MPEMRRRDGWGQPKQKRIARLSVRQIHIIKQAEKQLERKSGTQESLVKGSERNNLRSARENGKKSGSRGAKKD